jgi:hypothetical protein
MEQTERKTVHSAIVGFYAFRAPLRVYFPITPRYGPPSSAIPLPAGEEPLPTPGTMSSGAKKMPSHLKKHEYSPQEVSVLTRRTMTAGARKYEYSPEEVSLLPRRTMGSRVKKMPSHLKKHEYSPQEVPVLTRRTMTSGMKNIGSGQKKMSTVPKNIGSGPKKMSSIPKNRHITTPKQSQFRDLSSTLNRKGPLWPILQYL